MADCEEGEGKRDAGGGGGGKRQWGFGGWTRDLVGDFEHLWR